MNPLKVPAGSRILNFGKDSNNANKSSFCGFSKVERSTSTSIVAARLRVQAIREGVARLEKQLRRNMKSYVEAWHIIASTAVPGRTLTKFRDLPWPITDGWATAPEEITKDEIQRFLFAKCNIPNFSTRAEVFKTALAFWEPTTFVKKIRAWYPGSATLPDNVLEGAKLVYTHIQELEGEMEPEQAAERKRLREEEELRNAAPPPPKRMRFVTDVWDKFTGVLRFPTSFNFNAMVSVTA